ncbi:MAG: DUF3857 domain-containing protein [Spirochaetota bacterium]|nr:DUF3857 domain-containing protein [Spirochaetota bacterium]
MQKIKIIKIKIICIIILINSLFLCLILTASSSSSQYNNKDFQKDYLQYKSLGKYRKAIKILTEWTLLIEDPIMIEVNIFRINELIVYPELIEITFLSLNKILEENNTVKNRSYLRERINIFLNNLLLRQGRIDDALAVRDSLGFLDSFKIIGPFNNRGAQEFNTIYPPEKKYIGSGRYNGKFYKVRWFDINIDLTGKIDFSDIFTDIDDSLFYLYKEIVFPKSRQCVITVGKTGYTDIWLDNKLIFSNRSRHGFQSDQYKTTLLIPKGKHHLLIKTGDSKNNGTKFSIRITDIKDLEEKISIEDLRKRNNNETIQVTYFNSLNMLLNSNKSYNNRFFLIGYLFYISGLNSQGDKESLSFFNRSSQDHKSISAYYQGLSEENDIKKDFYFNESLRKNKKNIETLKEIAKIKLSYNFLYEANRIIESIKNIDPHSTIYSWLNARVIIKSGWSYKALKTASKLKESLYPSIACLIEARIHRMNKKFKEAQRPLEYLHQYDRSNRNYIDNLLESYKKTGNHNKAINLLSQSSRIFPNNIWIRLKLSEVAKNTLRAKASLPYISSALKLSPYNRRALFEIGTFYHKIGKKDIAKYYLNLASKYDPTNFALKRYLKIINNERNEIDEHLIKEDPSQLARKAEKYKSEPAINILKETAIRVLPDGSYEKWIHNTYMINDTDAINDFSTQYIITDPSTDRIENLKCFVINNGARTETSVSYKRSLSDPASRLYYDMEANIIQTPSLKKGSLIDLSYVIKSKSGKIYKSFPGERIITRDKYRTMHTNILISFPANKHIYYHIKKIKDEDVKIIKNSKTKIYKISINNILPYKKENAMPHPSEISPIVYFTSHKEWSDLYRWYIPLLKSRIRMSEEMKKTLNQIISIKDSNLEKVRKIYNHVNKEIRYVGFEFGIGGIQPRSSDMTYHTRMGDCKDITLVLVAMLKEAGIDASISLIRTRDSGKTNFSVPYIGEFNHAICYVNLNGGFFLDGTAKMSGFRELPSDNRNSTTLVLNEKGFQFIDVSDRMIDNNLEIANTEVDIDKTGKAILKRKIYKKGISAPAIRYEMKDIDRKKKNISEYWNKKYTGSVIESFKVVDINIDRPSSYAYQINIPSFLHIGDEEEIIFKAFLMPSNYYSNFCMLKKREFPISLSSKWTTKVKITYRIPENFKIYRIPVDEEYNSKKFDAHFQFKQTGQSIEVISLLKFKKYRIDVSEYDDLRKFTRLIEKKENERIILIRKK